MRNKKKSALRHPLVFRCTQKLHPLVLSVLFSFFSCRPRKRGPSKRETKKRAALRSHSNVKTMHRDSGIKILASLLHLAWEVGAKWRKGLVLGRIDLKYTSFWNICKVLSAQLCCTIPQPLKIEVQNLRGGGK